MFALKNPPSPATEDSGYYSEETQTGNNSTCESMTTERRVHWPTDTVVTSLAEYPRHLGGHNFPPENPNWVKLGTTSFEANMCHGCEQTIEYGEGHRCTICPDYRLCKWCVEYDISTKPHSRSHALEEEPILDISPPQRKKKVVPTFSTCPACPRSIPHVSAEFPLEKKSNPGVNSK